MPSSLDTRTLIEQQSWQRKVTSQNLIWSWAMYLAMLWEDLLYLAVGTLRGKFEDELNYLPSRELL